MGYEVYGKNNCIEKAASMVLCGRYRYLQSLCDNHKTVSTRRLAQEIERLREETKLDGIFLREVSKHIGNFELKLEQANNRITELEQALEQEQ